MSTSTALKPIDEVRGALIKMQPEFMAALPSHVSVDKFQRVTVTAINSNADILEADRRSLYAACMKAAQDGLLPDGREAAFVVYNTKQKNGAYVKAVQYMPMVGGLLKKIRQSGELSSIGAHVVYEADEFDYYVDEEGEHFRHRPNIMADHRGKPVLVYCLAKTKDGGIYFEPMTIADIEKVRSVSRSKDRGPWVDWWDEQAKKSVIKRISKRLPMSTDLEQAIRHDNDADYGGEIIADPAPTSAPEPAATPAQKRKGRPRGLQAAVDQVRHDQDTGEIHDAEYTDAPPAPIEPAQDGADNDEPPI